METKTPGLNVLSFFLAPRELYRNPLFSTHEVFCGPDVETKVHDGRVATLKTPAGSHDAAHILAQLPVSQHPELIVVKADSTQRNCPRNLAAFKCPKVLLVGDTHHQRSPISSVISYAQSEPFDFVVMDHTRHHAHWFAQAGVKNLHWIPALDYGFLLRDLREPRTRPLTFVGNTGVFHPWRRTVLTQLLRSGLPLEILQGTPREAADCYANSEVTLNISLNGDLNLRVFEALSAGGFLLTDALSDASGLSVLFEAGKHLETWSSPGELQEKIRHYLNRPDEVTRIRRQGQLEILRSHRPETKTQELLDLVFKGRVNPRYDLGLNAPKGRGQAVARLEPERIRHLSAYEWIQETHRTSLSTTVFCAPSLLAETLSLADLPRLHFADLGTLRPLEGAATTGPCSGNEEVLWLSDAVENLQDLLCRFTGGQVIAPVTLAARLSEWGFHSAARADDGAGLFRLTQPVSFVARAFDHGARETVLLRLAPVLASTRAAPDCLELARCAQGVGASDLQLAALQRAVSLDRSCQPALIQLAAVALKQRDNTFAAMVLEEARRCGPLPCATDRIRLHLRTGAEAALGPYLALSGRNDPERVDCPQRILIVTNLFPPQELGGYGRMMWEFARGLRSRGHAVSVLTGDAPYTAKAPSDEEAEMESHVSRSLVLAGGWTAGAMHVLDAERRAVAERANAERLSKAAAEFEPDFVLLGNLDLIGVDLVHQAIAEGHPVIHAVANKEPGYAPSVQPRSASYWMAPCSNWNGAALSSAGYAPGRMATLYPGARIDRFYRVFSPGLHPLRIAYASLVAPYKGTHVLVEALARLNALGVDFSAEIAGEAMDPAFADKLKAYCMRSGLAGKVTFTGFLDRAGLASLYARSNVLVFPSQFPEPFGISQVEAMASGLVVVSSGTGGAAEIVRDNQDGLLFTANDPSSLAARLRALSEDPALFQRLQAAGQRRSLQFSVEAAVKQIEQLGSELCGKEVSLTEEPPLALEEQQVA